MCAARAGAATKHGADANPDTTARHVSIRHQRTENIIEELCRGEKPFGIGIGRPLLAEICDRLRL
jgi:hypothetical protein